MLRLVLLVLYLIASYSSLNAPSSGDAGGGWDPNGRPSPTVDGGGGLDPDGKPTTDIGGGWDPDGRPSPTVDGGGGLDPNG